MDWDVLIKLTAASVLTTISPGPNFVIVTQLSLLSSRRAALWAIGGMALAAIAHMGVIFWGLGQFVHHPKVLYGLRLFGAIYLFGLGSLSLLEAYRHTRPVHICKPRKPFSSRDAFRIGFITNLVNVQGVLFMLSFLTALVPTSASPTQQVLLYGWRVLLGVSWFVCVAFLFSHTQVRQKFLRHARLIQIVTGIALCCLGLNVLSKI